MRSGTTITTDVRGARVLIVALAMALSSGACAGSTERVEPVRDLDVRVRDGAMIAPDTVVAGWSTLRVREEGAPHIVVLFKVTGASDSASMARALTALDSGAITPEGLVALGGPEVGDSGAVIVRLDPGLYLLGCVRRGDDEHRHLANGESHPVVATSPPNTPRAPPKATHDVRMTDFAFPGEESWRAGKGTLRVVNDGTQDHQLRLARLDSGATLATWIKSGGEIGTDLTGVARLGARREAYLDVDLAPGFYVLYCLVTDPRSGKPHVDLGMLKLVTVR